VCCWVCSRPTTPYSANVESILRIDQHRPVGCHRPGTPAYPIHCLTPSHWTKTPTHEPIGTYLVWLASKAAHEGSPRHFATCVERFRSRRVGRACTTFR